MPPLHLTWENFLLIGGIVTAVLTLQYLSHQPRRVQHEQRQGGQVISRPGTLYLALVLLLCAVSWSYAAFVAYDTLTSLGQGTYSLPQMVLAVAAAFTTDRLLRRGLTQQVLTTPEGLYIEQWNHSVYLPWEATEGQWNLRAGRMPFYGVIQRRGTAPLMLRRYRLSVCLKETLTRPPRTLNRPGHVIDVTTRD